jgi:hypothetical protein
MSTIGSKGASQSLIIVQGDDFLLPITLLSPAIAPALVGVPVNLTACQVIAQIRKTFNAPATSAVFVVRFSATPIDGSFSISLGHDITSALACGVDENDPKSQYLWDLKLIDSLGVITTIMGGSLTVYREISK